MPLSLLLTRIDSLLTLSDEDVACIRDLRVEERHVKAGEEIVILGDHPTRSFVLSEGFTCGYKITGPGARQIVNLHVPGDMPDLQRLHAREVDVSMSALTDVRLTFIAHEDIRAACHSRPNLTVAFWRMTLIEGGIAREWIVNVGQRDGLTRLAHLICEMYTRLDAVGLVRDGSCSLPITQIDLADTTGMTPVHVNRMLQELRRDGFLQLRQKQLTVPNFGRLAHRADFDPMYLQLATPPTPTLN